MEQHAKVCVCPSKCSRGLPNVCCAADTSSKTIVTHSKPTAFPSALRSKRSEVQTLNEADMQTNAVIDERCEKCGREQVRFYTQQLRSADEGTTVFYECECGNKWVYPMCTLTDLVCSHIFPVDGTQTTKSNTVLHFISRNPNALHSYMNDCYFNYAAAA